MKMFEGQLILLVLAFYTSFVWAENKPLKIAFMHQNPVGQGGWTLSHENARKKLEEHYGDKIETTAVDGISPGVDAERVLTKFARDNNDLIFATSFSYLNPVKKVARKFRRATFEHASGYLTAPNLGTYQIRAYQGRYLSGYIAGKTTKTNRIGFVGSFPIPEVIRGINAFTLGIQAANPEAKLELIWVNSWSDPSKEKEATELLIAKGVDIVTHHTESSAIMQAAAQAEVYSIGYQMDRSAAAKNYHLVSVEHNWFPIYVKKIDAMLAGTWQSEQDWIGVEENASKLVGFNSELDKSLIDDVEKLRAEIAGGQRKVFSGPIKNQSGELVIEMNTIMTDEQMLSMEWLVDGVFGKLEK